MRMWPCGQSRGPYASASQIPPQTLNTITGAGTSLRIITVFICSKICGGVARIFDYYGSTSATGTLICAPFGTDQVPRLRRLPPTITGCDFPKNTVAMAANARLQSICLRLAAAHSKSTHLLAQLPVLYV